MLIKSLWLVLGCVGPTTVPSEADFSIDKDIKALKVEKSVVNIQKSAPKYHSYILRDSTVILKRVSKLQIKKNVFKFEVDNYSKYNIE